MFLLEFPYFYIDVQTFITWSHIGILWISLLKPNSQLVGFGDKCYKMFNTCLSSFSVDCRILCLLM